MRNKKTIITATSLLAVALLLGTIANPAVATSILEKEEEVAIDITAETVEPPKEEETEVSTRQGFVRPVSPTDYEGGSDDVSSESSTAVEDIELIGFEDYGDMGATGIGGGSELEMDELQSIPNDPSEAKIAIALAGNVDPGYQYEAEVDLCESQEFVIDDDIIEFEILAEGDDKYNIKSDIYLDYDESYFTFNGKLHFTALGVDEFNDLWKTLSLLRGAILAMVAVAAVANIAMEVLILAVEVVIALPLILWFGFNEAQQWINVITDMIRDNWHRRELLADMIVDLIQAAAVKFVDTYSLLTEGNGAVSFVPGLKGTLKQNCNPEDGYFDITITAISGQLSDSKVIRVYVTNPGSGESVVGETMENSNVIEGDMSSQGQSQGTNNL